MLVSMHQPDYLPWLGYFNKIAVSDLFIFFDTADNSGGGFHNRNKIRTKDGWIYLTIPIEHENYFIPLKDVKLPSNSIWASKHLKSMKSYYAKSPFWKDYSPFFEGLYNRIEEFSSLAELNIEIIDYMSRQFGLSAKMIKVSELQSNKLDDPSETIIRALKEVGATKFLAGPSGKDYLNRARFIEEGIDLLFQEFHPKEYRQVYQEFIPGLSAVDLLFNEGKDSIKYLK